MSRSKSGDWSGGNNDWVRLVKIITLDFLEREARR